MLGTRTTRTQWRTGSRKSERPANSRPAGALVLVSVYRLPEVAPRLLYRLLQERDKCVNISHRAMPSWKQHTSFIARRPYRAWYLIRCGADYVGAIYLTALNEIGISILKAWHGQSFGPRAIQMLIRRHGRRRYLANINPANETSIRMFERLGFRLIQHTYALPV